MSTSNWEEAKTRSKYHFNKWHRDTDCVEHLGKFTGGWQTELQAVIEDGKPLNWANRREGTGKRIVKAHTFAHQLDKLKAKGHPIVMVYRNDYECLEWWKLCGEFNITYPNYQHFENLDKMWEHIQAENRDTMQFIKDNKDRITQPKDNVDLCRLLEISFPNKGRLHNYAQKGIQIYVYK